MTQLTKELTVIITTTIIMEVKNMIWKQHKINVTEDLEQVLHFLSSPLIQLCTDGVIPMQ
jgi:hypothetical protein